MAKPTQLQKPKPKKAPNKQKHRNTPDKAKPASKAKPAGGQAAKPATANLKPEEGKQKVARPAYMQPKLAVSKPGDKHEQEADRVADEVSRMPRGKGTDAQAESVKSESKRDAPQSVQTQISRVSGDEEKAAERTTDNHGDADAGEPQLSEDAERKVESLRGQGQRLPTDLRQEMEGKLNADLGKVRVHTGPDADALCKQINARAFTVSNDVFFASGEYAPESGKGHKLLAHELTHVVQQSGGVSRRVMREEQSNDGVDNRDASLPDEYSDGRGEIETSTVHQSAEQQQSDGENDANGPAQSGKHMIVNGLKVPSFKLGFYTEDKPDGQEIYWRRNEKTGGEARNTNQIHEWESNVEAEADKEANKKFDSNKAISDNGQDIYYFSYARGAHNILGTKEDLIKRMRRPLWDKNGDPTPFQVDHQIEWQTGGVDDISNMWLLAQKPNQDSGREIKDEIKERVGDFIEHVQGKVANPPDNLSDARTNYHIQFEEIEGGLGSFGNIREHVDYFTKSDIENGEHLSGLHAMGRSEVERAGFTGDSQDKFYLFPNGYGGHRYQLTKEQGSERYTMESRVGSADKSNFDIVSVNRTADSSDQESSGSGESGASSQPALSEGDEVANVIVKVPGESILEKYNKRPHPVELDGIPVLKIAGMQNGGRFNKRAFEDAVTTAMAEFPGLSPLSIDQVDFDAGGIVLNGRIHPTLSLVSNCDVNFGMEADEIRVWKTFSTGDIDVPSPLSLDDTSLSLGISTRGLFMEGRVEFGIDRIGNGCIEAGGHVGRDGAGGLSLAGEFNFDERLFGEGTEAQVRAAYEEGNWTLGGTISIPEGKVPGINSATVEVEYSEENGFHASGDAELDVPGVESGHLEITQSEDEGFSIGGEFELSGETPGIRGGSISATLTEKADGSGYALSASGEAQPDIPGIDSNLSVTYDDGVFSADLHAEYARSMLSGQIDAGVTNRVVNDDGTLGDGVDPDGNLAVHGGGELTLQLTPWLGGTAGVQFAPNGDLTVIGEIGLPDEVELFDVDPIEKDIFHIATQAPIIPGVVAEIGGGLDARANIGPAVLDQLSLRVEYSPDHEEDTHIHGSAHLNVPADAGLRLSVRAGVGLGITGASATGGLEIGGALGIEGAAEASVDVDWTPSAGLDITSEVSVHAQPSFTFDISGYVKVEVAGFSLYDETWRLAEYSFGSDYRFGISLPIHYHEGEPFDVSLSDVEFQVPDINTDRLLQGLVERIS